MKLINIKDGWYNKLKHVIESEQFSELGKFIAEERKTKEIYPLKNEVFRIFNDLDFNDVKIVLLSQDPYPSVYKNEPVACGYSFAPRHKEFMPPSLKQIFKALKNGVYDGVPVFETDLDMSTWVKQGVMLLNMGLTVEKGNPSSHVQKWEFFTKEVIKSFNNTSGIIFMLWGAHAHKIEPLINQDLNYVLKCSHPASAVYNGTDWKCDNFMKANQILFGNHGDLIHWLDIETLSSQQDLQSLI
jgi:uracil-DNA glycosylase